MTSRVMFGVVDYVVFGLTLLFSALIGVLFRFTGGKQKTTEEFFLGSKDMSVIPVAFSIMTSYFSAAGMLGLSSESYLYGFHLAYKGVLCVITTPIITYVYHTVFYNLGMTTVNEYLNRRFGKYARGSATIVYMLQVMLYMAVALYGPSLTLSIVSGISLWASILSVGIVCTFYCTLGGIKAVIWTDFFQVVLMFTTVIVVIVKGSLDVGGIGEMWRIAYDGGRINFSSFKFDVTDRYGFWSLMIGGIFFQLSVNSVNQTQVQRIMTLGSLKKSRQAIWVTQPLAACFLVGLCLCGIVMYSSMGACDPLLRFNETGVTKSDQLLPYFVMQSLGKYPGLPGLCVSGLFSASISSLSSGINSLAAVTLEDFIKPYCCVGKLTEPRAAFVTKILVLTYGTLCILLSYMVGQMGVLMQACVTIFGILGGPVLGLFTLGMLFVRPNEKGAVVGLIVSSAFFLWIGFGNNISKIPSTRLPQTTKGCPNITSIIGNSTFSVSGNTTSTVSTYIEDSFKFDVTDRYGFWSLMIGGIFFHLSINSINQTQVQRMLTIGSLKKSRQAIWVTQPLLASFLIGLCLCGVVIYSNMCSCDPLLRKNETGVTASDQLLPYFVMQSLGKYPGLPGLCVSGIFSASISTISSGVNSLAAVTLEDFIKPYCCVGKLTESRAAFVTKILVLTFGTLCILLSYMVEQMGVLMQVSVTVLGVLGGPVFGLFTLGMLFIRPNEKGAVVGLIVSSVLFLWIGVGNNISNFHTKSLRQTIEGCPNITSIIDNSTFFLSDNITSTIPTYAEDRYVFPLYKVSYWWFSVFGCLLTIILGYFVSIITGPNQLVDEELLTPFARWMNRHSSRKEEDIKLEFKHKDSDLVRSETRNKTSHIPGVMADIKIPYPKEGIGKHDFR